MPQPRARVAMAARPSRQRTGEPVSRSSPGTRAPGEPPVAAGERRTRPQPPSRPGSRSRRWFADGPDLGGVAAGALAGAVLFALRPRGWFTRRPKDEERPLDAVDELDAR